MRAELLRSFYVAAEALPTIKLRAAHSVRVQTSTLRSKIVAACGGEPVLCDFEQRECTELSICNQNAPWLRAIRERASAVS